MGHSEGKAKAGEEGGEGEKKTCWRNFYA